MLVVLLVIARSLLAGLGSRRELMLGNLALRHPVQLPLRPIRPRAPTFGLSLVGAVAQDMAEWWREQLRVVRPETVIRWRRKGWRLRAPGHEVPKEGPVSRKPPRQRGQF